MTAPVSFVVGIEPRLCELSVPLESKKYVNSQTVMGDTVINYWGWGTGTLDACTLVAGGEQSLLMHLMLMYRFTAHSVFLQPGCSERLSSLYKGLGINLNCNFLLLYRWGNV